MYRSSFVQLFREAIARDQTRIKCTFFRCWSRSAAYILATRQANFQVMQEGRRAKQLRDHLRRRAAGPNEDEFTLQELSFSSWCAHVSALSHIRRRLAQVSARG